MPTAALDDERTPVGDAHDENAQEAR